MATVSCRFVQKTCFPEHLLIYHYFTPFPLPHQCIVANDSLDSEGLPNDDAAEYREALRQPLQSCFLLLLPRYYAICAELWACAPAQRAAATGAHEAVAWALCAISTHKVDLADASLKHVLHSLCGVGEGGGALLTRTTLQVPPPPCPPPSLFLSSLPEPPRAGLICDR